MGHKIGQKKPSLPMLKHQVCLAFFKMMASVKMMI